MLFYKSGCRASARRAAEGRTRLCRDQSNAMLALSPKESTEAVVACGIRFCVSSAETGGKFRRTGRFLRLRCGCSSVAFICRLGAEIARARRGLRGILAWGGLIPYLAFSSSKSPVSIAFLRQKKNNATMQTALICHLHLTMQYEHSCNVAIFISG